ncbi:MAG TPA: two-component regulator propeller domain-containing protein [Gemmatimonadales bacterium]|jgi:signal transduction histidine kinase/ligand-binding sensor domain-containing protein
MSKPTFAVVRLTFAVACCGYVSLSAQSPDLGQYEHTAWTVRDGAPGGVRDLAQGTDGVLWIASERGLFQFDGIRFERFEPPPGQTLSPHAPLVLLALPDTSLWIGHFTAGVTVIHQGKIVSYGTDDGLPGGAVTAIARDSSGTMWAATSRGLARLVGRRWEEMDTAAGYPGGYTEPVFVDGSGSVWAAAGPEIYVLPRGAARFEKRELSGVGHPRADVDVLAPAPDGSVWAIYRSYGVFPLADGRGGPPPPRSLAYPDSGIYALAWSRDHPAVAIGTSGRLVRLWLSPLGGTATKVEAGPPRAITIPFSRSAGMSGNLVVAARYDREGSLWVATPTGIDQFRETKLTPIIPPGVLEAAGVAPDTNGMVWVAARRGTPAALLTVADRIIPRLDAPPTLTCIYRDLRGDLWVGGRGLWERKGVGFTPVALPVPPGTAADGREIQAVARERDGGLWVAITFNVGVFRRRPGRGWELFGVEQGLDRSVANVITTDSSGRTWLGYQRGALVLVVGDSVRVFAAEQGLNVGRVLAISVYGDRVWIGGQSGVAAFDSHQASGSGRPIFIPLTPAGEPLRGVSGIVQTTEGELWLNGADGVTRIPAAEVDRALAEPGDEIRYERFDYRDGIEPPAQQVRPLPSAAAGTDGRIWFASAGGVVWVDPRRVRRNPVPPPVHLRALTAGGQSYFAGNSAGDTVRLPPRTSALGVAYTAYSLAVPDRVRFKYRLEGLDTTWQDAGGRREAFFTNLPPGRYRFNVIASNDDGVWNTAGASLAFTIAPAWNQTWWFLALVALTLLATPALAAVAWQRRRARLAAAHAQARFDAMLAERTRVARELHDTLLGGMAGVAMQLDIGARRLAAGDNTSVIADLLSTLASQARYVLAETRKVVGAMRASPQPQLVHEQLAGAVQRTFSGTEVEAHLTQSGTERSYPATLEAEIVSIAGEALANARNHSGCRTVWVICDSGPRELRVGVRDDGCGFDPAQAPPSGHWGLIGMRERAASIGARLTVTSAPGAGTEVVLVLPQRSGWSALWSRLVRRNSLPQ